MFIIVLNCTEAVAYKRPRGTHFYPSFTAHHSYKKVRASVVASHFHCLMIRLLYFMVVRCGVVLTFSAELPLFCTFVSLASKELFASLLLSHTTTK